MTEIEQQDSLSKSPKRPRKHRAGAGLWATMGLAIIVLALGALILSGRAVSVPATTQASLVQSINDRLKAVRMEVGRTSVAISDRRPQVRFRDVKLQDDAGTPLAALNEVIVDLSPGALLQGRVSANRVTLDGAQITVRRGQDGSFSLTSTGAGDQPPISLSAVLSQVHRVMNEGPLALIEAMEARGIVLTLEDARSGRLWQATNARLTLSQRTDGVSVSITSDVFNGTDDLAGIQVSLTFSETSGETEVGVRFIDMPARDIARQAEALAWLSVLDAPISGAMRARLDEGGELVSLDGTLDVEEGALGPDGAVDAIPFEAARAYFSYDPGARRLDFVEAGIQSPTLRLTASGHSYIVGDEGAWADTFVGQFVVQETVFAEASLFDDALSIDRMHADWRLSLDPFRVELGEVSVEDADARARASGVIDIFEGKWRVSVDAEIEQIDRSRVLTFWPSRLGPKTRKWLSENVAAGVLTDVAFGVRYLAGQKPDLSLSFDFQDASVRYLKDMPPAEDAAGRATLHDRRFTIEVDAGEVTAPGGRTIDGTGTVFSVPDIRERPTRGELALKAAGPLQSVLEVIDLPPLGLLSRAGRGTDFASGDTVVSADVRLPLVRGPKVDQVDFDVRASAVSVTSSDLVPGRELRADRLDITATPEELTIVGPARLDGVPIETAWRLPLGVDLGDGSRAEGEIAIGAEALEAFGVAVPPGMVSGSGTASYAVDLRPDAPPVLTLSSSLEGIGLSIPGLNWQKPRATEAGLDLEIVLDETPDVRLLELSAPGLALSGDVVLDQDGAFQALDLRRLRVGRWLDATAQVRPGQGARDLQLSIEAGQLDLRELPARNERPASEGSSPISVELDTVTVTDAISIAPLIGTMVPGNGGVDGAFEGRLAGRTLLRISLAASGSGTAVRVESDDAGGVLRDAGLTPNATGGSFFMVMSPVPGAAPGNYNGEFRIENTRIEDAPVLAGLLSAISVVGLLDQLTGGGIGFDVIEGSFRLSPDRISLTGMSAVGPSLGLSADGVFDPINKQLDMQGVVSPIYFLNGIGSFLTRPGEGLFGFTYRLTGPTNGPTISVNPLSLLTPGMFREIFRRPVPTQ